MGEVCIEITAIRPRGVVLMLLRVDEIGEPCKRRVVAAPWSAELSHP